MKRTIKIVCFVLIIVICGALFFSSNGFRERATIRYLRRDSQRLLTLFIDRLPEQSEEENLFLDMVYDFFNYNLRIRRSDRRLVITTQYDGPITSRHVRDSELERNQMAVLVSQQHNNRTYTVITATGIFGGHSFWSTHFLIVQDADGNIVHVLDGAGGDRDPMGRHANTPVELVRVRIGRYYVIFGRASLEYWDIHDFNTLLLPREESVLINNFDTIEFGRGANEVALSVPLNALDGLLVITRYRLDRWRMQPYEPDVTWSNWHGLTITTLP
ncbi:MAG: hypothetical protein FWB93_04105 [Oscillospiraceae bacterium]|nr:hypothetical protein [Oscillospiraceae bacterium]